MADGWIGPDTYHACRTVHKVRNAMAHSIEVDSFDHDGVKGLIDEAKPPQELFMNTTDGVKKVNLKSRTDKFLITVLRVLKVGFESVDHRR